MGSAQLTLGISLKDEAHFDNFYAGQNAEIVSELKKAILAQGEKVIFLSSKHGQGCTHLLQACCHFAAQHGSRAVFLPLKELSTLSPEVLTGLETLDLVCLDDLGTIAKLPIWEEAVFHLFNRVHDAGGVIVMGAHDLPKALPFALPDLQSRLSWGIVYQLKPLTDQEKLKVLKSSALRRGFSLSEEVARYLLTHFPRQLDKLFSTLNVLDSASLSAQRKITIPFVKEVLQK